MLVTHFHLDHCAAVPYVTGHTPFRGRVLMTHPTKAIVHTLLRDFVKVSRGGTGALRRVVGLGEAYCSASQTAAADLRWVVERSSLQRQSKGCCTPWRPELLVSWCRSGCTCRTFTLHPHSRQARACTARRTWKQPSSAPRSSISTRCGGGGGLVLVLLLGAGVVWCCCCWHGAGHRPLKTVSYSAGGAAQAGMYGLLLPLPACDCHHAAGLASGRLMLTGCAADCGCGRHPGHGVPCGPRAGRSHVHGGDWR